MALTKTPICDYGKKAENFKLKSTENKIISLNDIRGINGTLIMFICNHCPYVKAVISDIVNDCKNLSGLGVNSLAICSNDADNYPEDSFENMMKFAKQNYFNFPYLHDEDQKIAYSNDERITYGGLFTQIEYANDKFSAFFQGSVSNQYHQRFDHMTYVDDALLDGSSPQWNGTELPWNKGTK